MVIVNCGKKQERGSLGRGRGGSERRLSEPGLLVVQSVLTELPCRAAAFRAVSFPHLRLKEVLPAQGLCASRRAHGLREKPVFLKKERAEEMAQWIKYLPYKHKDPSSGPLYPFKKLAIVVYNSRAEGAETSDPDVHGPANQAELKSFRISE